MPDLPASHRDLLDSGVATLATIGPDGRPQLSAVWFVSDGQSIELSLNSARQKTKNLVANPKCNLFILDLNTPSRYLEVRADAEISPDADGACAARVNAKYGAHVEDNDREGETRVKVALLPVRVNAIDIAH